MMALSPTNLTLLVAGVLICIQIYLYWSRARKVPPGFRHVPSPKGLPLIGNSLQLGKHPRKQFEKWTEEYGELFKIQLGWNNWVFLNSREAVKEILDRQSASTSSRMPLPVSSDLASGGYRFLMMGYTPTWRKLRAIVHKLLTPKASDVFKPSQDFEAKQLVYDILTDNTTEEEFYMHIRRYTTSVVMTSTYGKRVPNWVRLWPVIVSCHLS
jgi:cytochrome P450